MISGQALVQEKARVAKENDNDNTHAGEVGVKMIMTTLMQEKLEWPRKRLTVLVSMGMPWATR
jgi:hypothetical protein